MWECKNVCGSETGGYLGKRAISAAAPGGRVRMAAK
jgi:hypothetical protein